MLVPWPLSAKEITNLIHIDAVSAVVRAYTPGTAVVRPAWKTPSNLPGVSLNNTRIKEISVDWSSVMEKLEPDKHEADSLSRQTTTAEGQVGQLEKKFSKLTMTGMAFAILK
jgi:hypothetical protein